MKIKQAGLELVGIQIVEGMVSEHSKIILVNPNPGRADFVIKEVDGKILTTTRSAIDGSEMTEVVKDRDWVMIDSHGYHYTMTNKMFNDFGYEVVQPEEYKDSVEECEGYPVLGGVKEHPGGSFSGYIGTEYGHVFVMSGFVCYKNKTMFLIPRNLQEHKRVYNRVILDKRELGELATQFAMEVESEV